MIKMYSPSASRDLDVRCIQAGITESALITMASSAAVKVIRQILAQERFDSSGQANILVVCGPGNNGADGLMIAGMLCDAGTVTVLIPSASSAVSAGYVFALEGLADGVRRIEHHHVNKLDGKRFDVVIDALLGTGARRPLSDDYRRLADMMNSSSECRIAIDIPTGLDGLTGEIDRGVVRCQHTVTMEGIKPGMLRESGPDICGRIHVVSIGAPKELSESSSDGVVLESDDVAQLIPVRHRVSSKFDYGHVLVIGGSLGMRGAPSMTAHAALSIGAGMVELVTPSVHPLTPREIMTHTVGYHDDGTMSADSLNAILRRCARATVVAIGPGMGSNPGTVAMMAEVINAIPQNVTIVLDADGLRCLPLISSRKGNLILTPHLGELSRILNTTRDKISTSYVEYAASIATTHNAVVHIKHVPAATCTSEHVSYLQRGNPALATAGAGDILTGIIAGLAAQGMQAYDAARCGAWLHASAADEIVRLTHKVNIMAAELIDVSARLRGELTASRL
ncbi:MAG: NAD(P)H-hydrate dehydratase [Candidatus Kapabacteria bacterium]|nr:NAD(P)H-hydrate dehydratase [Candidatus Kapabacteria bacterium]